MITERDSGGDYGIVLANHKYFDRNFDAATLQHHLRTATFPCIVMIL